MNNAEFNIGDIVQTKKQHPCGCDKWEIIRTGVDIKIKCVQCGRIILLPRLEFKKKIKKIIEKKSGSEE
jgi:hypothetical protein